MSGLMMGVYVLGEGLRIESLGTGGGGGGDGLLMVFWLLYTRSSARHGLGDAPN